MSKSNVSHPGRYIREVVLPVGITVTAAAKLLGVGRPALSKLLNGRAELSPNMADRLHIAFGCDSKDLLRRQNVYNGAQFQPREPKVGTRAFPQRRRTHCQNTTAAAKEMAGK